MENLSKVISGGETGIDQAALEAAQRCGIATGGAIGVGFVTEKGRQPTLGAQYNLVELDSKSARNKSAAQQHVMRSIKNVEDSDGTLIFGAGKRGSLGGIGTYKTLGYCISGRWESPGDWANRVRGRTHKPVLVIEYSGLDLVAPEEFSAFIKDNDICTLNVAGPRASKMIGEYDAHVNHLVELFSHALRHARE